MTYGNISDGFRWVVIGQEKAAWDALDRHIDDMSSWVFARAGATAEIQRAIAAFESFTPCNKRDVPRQSQVLERLRQIGLRPFHPRCAQLTHDEVAELLTNYKAWRTPGLAAGGRQSLGIDTEIEAEQNIAAQDAAAAALAAAEAKARRPAPAAPHELGEIEMLLTARRAHDTELQLLEAKCTRLLQCAEALTAAAGRAEGAEVLAMRELLKDV